MPADENLAPEDLGGRIDRGLVEDMRVQLLSLKHGNIGIEAFEWKIRQIKEGMRENMALKAFAATLWESDKVPLASETYLKLANRHVVYGGKRSPSFEEGSRFARVLLAPFMKKSFTARDWDRQGLTRVWADSWLDSRDPDELQRITHASQNSPLAWDVLQLLCQELIDRGENPPYSLLLWDSMASRGHHKRPDEWPATRHRPATLGYKFRNNEIRHTVNLLALVGMPKAAARSAVAEAIDLAESRVGQICREPDFTSDQFRDDAMKSIDRSYYEFLHGPSSHAGPSSSA